MTALHNSQRRYGLVAIVLHWLIGCLVIVMLAVGFFMEDIGSNLVYQLHKSTGLLILTLTLIRLGWRLANPVPDLPATLTKTWERIAARGIHIGFYALLLVLPLSGWVMASAGEYPTIFYGLFEVPRLPVAGDLRQIGSTARDIHELVAWTTIGLLALHVGAAIRHHLVLKDDTLLRMLPERAS